MLAYRVFASATIIAVSGSLSGCIQWGEYGMGFTCESFSDEVVAIVQRELEGTAEVENLWAGASDVWCEFDLLIPEGFEAREVATQIERDVLSSIADMPSGVQVRVVDATGDDWVITDVKSPSTNR